MAKKDGEYFVILVEMQIRELGSVFNHEQKRHRTDSKTIQDR